MFITTHMQIAHYFYKRLSGAHENQKKAMPDEAFKLKPLAFVYGSIKPDLSQMAMMNHHFDESYEVFINHLQMAQDETRSEGQRSAALGVAVHFLCDYFCKYHAKSPYNTYSLMRHLAYEFRLHLHTTIELFKRRFTGHHYLMDGGDHMDKCMISQDAESAIEATVAKHPQVKLGRENRWLDLQGMLKTYHTKEESCTLDMDFALTAINGLLEALMGIRVIESDTGTSFIERGLQDEDCHIYGHLFTTGQRRDQYAEKTG